MKYLTQLALIALASLAVSFSASASGSNGVLAAHSAKGVACAQCHPGKQPQQAVKTETCLACHGSHEALAEKTKSKDPNPHFTHMGDMNCNECHNVHKPSVNQCGDCHTIPMNVP